MTDGRRADAPLVLYVTADTEHAADAARELPSVADVGVVTASSVNDALARLSTVGDVECVVSDHELPDVDGVAFLQAVRAQCPDLPFILFTSEGSEQVASRAVSASVTDYLVKEQYGDQWGKVAEHIERAVNYYRTRHGDRNVEGRAKVVLEASPDMMAIVQDGTIVYVNSAGVDLLGVDSPDELLGTPILDWIRMESDLTAARLDDVQAGRTHIDRLELSLQDTLDERIPAELTAARIQWGDTPSIVTILRDVSRRRQAQRSHRDVVRILSVIRQVNHLIVTATSRDELEAGVCELLADSEPYHLAWIGAYDAEAETVKPSAAAGEGVEYVGKIEITVDETPTGQGPTGRAVRTREVQTVQDISESPAFGPWRDAALEHGHRSSAAVPLTYDGDVYGVLNLYAQRRHAFDEDEAELLGELGKDIAYAIHALQVHAGLQRSEERLSFALDAADAGVWDWDIQTGDVVWHETCERLFGLDPGEFEGTYEGFAKRIHPDDVSNVIEKLERTMDRGEPFNCEFRIVREDGVERWMSAQGRVLTDDAGTPVRMIGVDVDVTERKEREQHLRVIDRVLRHNLRNDMNVIGGRAETIREEASGDIAASADEIISQSTSLLETADKERKIVEILTERPSFDEVDVVGMARRTAERKRQRHPEADVRLSLPDRATATVSGRFVEALDELVENAIVHNDRPVPEVTITVERTDGVLLVHVADNGPGIPEMNVEVLTGGRDIDPLYHGSGLGLWLVNWVVRRSRGTLAFEENDPRGSVVTIALSAGDESTHVPTGVHRAPRPPDTS